MAIQVPADIERAIRALVATGRFESEGDVMREAIRLLDRREQRIAEFRESIQNGLSAIERGEGIELTDDVWDRLDREARERIERGVEPDPDAWP